MELVSGSYGFEVVPRFLEHFWAPVLKYEDRKMGLGGVLRVSLIHMKRTEAVME